MGARRRSLKGLCALALAALVALAPSAGAKGPEIVLDAMPLLGSGAPDRGGWRSFLVRMENAGSQAIEGTLEVESQKPWTRGAAPFRTTLPFALAPHGKVSFEAPTHGFVGSAPSVKISARSKSGELIAEATIPQTRPFDALVLDLASPSRVTATLRGIQFSSRRGRPYGGRSATPAIAVTSALVDATTGDVVLPELSTSYAAATLVLASGRSLARLRDPERAALFSWVLSGGALALSLDRPEDLAEPALNALLGGRPERTRAPSALRAVTTFYVPPEEPEGSSSPMTPLKPMRLSPSSEVSNKLTGYAGANLREAPWGASASYGLGEVHLLAFDPEDAATAEDPWTRYKLSDLVRHAFDREPQAALRFGAASDTTAIDGIRRELDPNQATRWIIVVSAVVLVLYSMLAGPLTFHLAAKRGRPLRALWQLPIWSAATLGIIVLFGVLGKGVSGKARRLTVVDASAGMTHAVAARFRGFYAASSRELTVRAGRREHVIDVAGNVEDIPRTLIVDRDGPRLTGLRTKPWQTVLIREDGFIDLSGGISVVEDAGDYLIKNRTSSDLIGVVVKPPAGDARYFRQIKDGDAVRVLRGMPIGTLGTPSPGGSGVPLDVASFASTLDKDFPGLSKAWAALEMASVDGTEWWPDDVPVVIAAFDGGEGKLIDSGFAVDYDRVLVRIVGIGGVP